MPVARTHRIMLLVLISALASIAAASRAIDGPAGASALHSLPLRMVREPAPPAADPSTDATEVDDPRALARGALR